MADEPGLPDFQAAATEVTSAALPEPTRPEANYSKAGPGPDLVSMERWANDYDKAVQAHAQQREPQPDAPQQSEKQQALMEAAQALAPKENPNRDQQLEQERQRGGREI